MVENYSSRPIRGITLTGVIALGLGLAATHALAQASDPPSPLVVVSPINGATNTVLQLNLQWEGGIDPTGDVEQDLYFGTVSPPPLLEEGVWIPYRRSPPLQVATTYYWQIGVRDEHGGETFGPVWTFTTKATNTPPTAPTAAYPSNNSTNALVVGTLYWDSDDPDGYDEIYDVYMGTESPPPFVATITPPDWDETFPYSGLQFSTRYYWQVVARDPQGASTSGPIWTFTTKANSAPYAPGNPWPPNNGIGSTTAALAWGGGDVDQQPLTFDVYLGLANPPPLVATSLTAPTFEASGLTAGATYYWKVVASDGALSTTGPVWSFGARQAGDVVADNQLTVADAACAMEIYLWNTECGGPNSYLVADVNCDNNVTPADARCIHREATGLGCDICDAAIAPAAPEEATVAPSVTLSTWFYDGAELVVRLAVSGVSALNAFGLNVSSIPSVPLLQASRRGTTSAFDVMEYRQVSETYAYVGAYSLANHTVGADAEFVELRFDVSDDLPNYLFVDGFVDDLYGASALVLSLSTLVDVGEMPSRLALHPNYPNPFNPQTTISYELPAGFARVRLSIFDLSGRVVRTLVDDVQSGGSYEVKWEGRNDRGDAVASGVYFYALDAGSQRMTRKLVLLK